MLNKRSTEFEKRRSYVKTTIKLNFDKKTRDILQLEHFIPAINIFLMTGQ